MNSMKIPAHISIIMDGNGRWAKMRGEDRLVGHNAGTDSIRDCCEYAAQIGVKYLSLFAFSEENWNRPENEVLGLMSLMVKSITNEKPTFKKNNICFRVIGDRNRLSENLIGEIEVAERETQHNTGLVLIVFLSYSGKWDILQSVNKLVNKSIEAVRRGEEPLQISEKEFESCLSTFGVPDPDLIIRTSGEERISNFLLWQSAYSEFYFTNILWPDFRKTDLQFAIESYTKRDRRFGKTSEQL